MQEITLIGRIGSKDAAIYETANGNKFIAFSLAADGRVKGKTVPHGMTLFHLISASMNVCFLI